MDSHEKENLSVDAHLSQEPEIGRWLWALQETRQRTLRALSGLAPAIIDWLPGDKESSIGTVLYHIADIEADWLYVEVLEQPMPPEVAALFPHPTRDEQGHLTQVQGSSLEQHLRRLETVRSLLLDVYQPMALAEFRRARSLANYDVTPEWVLHHLMQHEAEHRGQLGSLRARAERDLAPG
jgi:uncharacterized damage-inducible protein DinB